MTGGGRTLLAKVWDDHVVRRGVDGAPDLLYVDLHLLHEMTSPQAFEGLRAAGRGVRRPELTMATEDHNVPTFGPDALVEDPLSRLQMTLLRRNCADFGVPNNPMGSAGNGIVHVIGPEQGLSQPGMTIMCGDSHTSTHGAFGALGLGIGTSEVEHVLATQTLWLARPRALEVRVEGELRAGVGAKDLALEVVRVLGPHGGQGSVLEFRGRAVTALSMEGRMTLCNMAIEAGARGGMVAPDRTTFDYLEGRRFAPAGAAWDEAREHWRSLGSDDDAVFDRSVRIDAGRVAPAVTWGTTPSQVVPIDGTVPAPEEFPEGHDREAARRALEYMGLEPGRRMRDVMIDTVFIGSCTNGRLEDLRAAAEVVAGRAVAAGVRAMVVPGSMAVRRAAEAEGIAEVFTRAGFEWRSSGCSMCTAMNPDRLAPGERAASTTNRNFEGRQGPSGRTHLVSPPVAAATALAGHLAAPADL